MLIPASLTYISADSVEHSTRRDAAALLPHLGWNNVCQAGAGWPVTDCLTDYLGDTIADLLPELLDDHGQPLPYSLTIDTPSLVWDWFTEYQWWRLIQVVSFLAWEWSGNRFGIDTVRWLSMPSTAQWASIGLTVEAAQKRTLAVTLSGGQVSHYEQFNPATPLRTGSEEHGEWPTLVPTPAVIGWVRQHHTEVFSTVHDAIAAVNSALATDTALHTGRAYKMGMDAITYLPARHDAPFMGWDLAWAFAAARIPPEEAHTLINSGQVPDLAGVRVLGALR